MADGKIEIDLEVKDSNAQQQAKKAGDDIAKGVESGLKNVGKSADSAAKDTEKSFKSAADSAKSSFSDVGSAAKSGFSDVGDAAKTAAGDASSAFENVPSDASGAFSDVSSEAKSGFDGVSDAAKTAADDTASAFDGVGDEIASDIDGVDDKAQGVFGTNIPASTAIAGAAVGVLATQILDIGENAVNTGMEFDKSMAQVAATMGTSVEEVQDLRNFAQEMGETTAFSASQSADALNYMALAGYDAETSMRVLPTVLNLAAAGNMDLARASDMVTDAQSALGLSVDEAEVMVDQMAKTSSKTNTSVEQLGDAFLTVGGTAKNLEGGTAELSQMLGILADNGVKGSEGGTALRNVILSLSAPTDKAADAIKDLGLEVFDAEGNMRSMPDIFNDMNDAMSDMTQQDRTNVLNDIFNKVDLKSVNALLGTSADRFDEVSDAIDNAKGSAQQMADTQLDNLAGDVTLLQSATEGFYIAVSDALTPALRGLTQFGTNTLMPFLTEGVKNFDKMAPAVLTLVTAIIALATKGKAVNALNSVFGSLTLKVNGTTVAFKNMTVAQKASAIATKSASVAMNALKTAAPILAITALVELGTMLYQTWQKDKEHTEKLTKATKDLESAATNASFDISSETDAVDDLSGAFERIDIDDFLDKHSQLADSIKDTNLAASTSQAMLDDYADTINRLAEKSDITEPELAELKNAVTQVNDALGTNYEVTEGGGGAYQIMADGIKVAKDEILKLIDAQKAQVRAEADMENYKATYQQWQEDLQKTAEAKAKVEEASKNLAQAEKDAQTASDPVARAKASADMAKYGQAIKDAEKDLEDIEATTGSTESAMNRLNERTNLNTMAMADNASAVTKAAASNQEFISGVQGAAVKLDDFVVALEQMGFTSDQIASLSQDDAMELAQAWQSGYDDMMSATDDVIAKIGGDFPQALKDMGPEAYKQAYGSGKQATKGFADGESNLGPVHNSTQSVVNAAQDPLASLNTNPYGVGVVDAFAGGMGSKVGDVQGKSTELGNASTSDLDRSGEAETAGSNVGSGFLNGISSWIENIANKAAEMANSALSAAKNALGIKSPSRVFRDQVGKNIALGVAKGIKNNKKYAEKSASEMSSAIVTAADKRLSNYKVIHNMTIKQEIQFWKTIKSKTKKGSQGWYDATKKLLDAKKKQKDEIVQTNNEIVSKAETWLERYELTHKVSEKYEVNYWKKIKKQVKKGTDAYWNALKHYVEAKQKYNEAQKQADDDYISKAETTLERRKLKQNVSLKYEWNYWKKRIKNVKKNSDAYWNALANVKDAEQAYYDGIVSNANNYVSRRQRLFNMTYKQEADYWKKILKKLKKGTSQYNEVYDNWLEAKNNATAETKEKNQELLDAEQDYVNKLRDIQEQLKSDIKAANDAYKDAINERKQALLSDMSMFDRYRKKVTISGAKLIENIKSQATAMKDYEKAMKTLEGRIGKGDLYDEISDMGMDGLRYIESLNAMSKDELEEFLKYYNERNKIAQREATRENKDLLTETNKTIKALNSQAKKDIQAAAKELKSTASDLNTTLSKSIAMMASNVKVSTDSINSSINSAISSLKKLDKRVSTTSTSSTKTYSIATNEPVQVPIAIAYNGRQAITDSNGAIQGYSLMASDLYGATRQTEMSLLKGIESMSIAVKQNAAAGGVKVYQENNFNVPIETPDDVSRTMRMQERYGLAGKYI